MYDQNWFSQVAHLTYNPFVELTVHQDKILLLLSCGEQSRRSFEQPRTLTTSLLFPVARLLFLLIKCTGTLFCEAMIITVVAYVTPHKPLSQRTGFHQASFLQHSAVTSGVTTLVFWLASVMFAIITGLMQKINHAIRLLTWMWAVCWQTGVNNTTFPLPLSGKFHNALCTESPQHLWTNHRCLWWPPDAVSNR